jgi:hypothetical protein
MSGALVIALILACVAALVLASRSRREGSGEIAARVSPEAATDRAVSYMVSLDFVLSQKTDTSATFSRRKRPNTDVGIVLLLLGIVPGALYFLLAGGERRTTVEAVPAEVGRGARLTVSGDDPDARKLLYAWAEGALSAPEEAEFDREPCWKCGSGVSGADVRCPSCGARLRPGR